uniref:Uncharacterized protein n=1 Tax=Rhizophora mucronata TaxID=61149 RepID=A0A2P2MYR4_RHIMU
MMLFASQCHPYLYPFRAILVMKLTNHYTIYFFSFTMIC